MRTQIMAILNITPDSFSDGGRFASLDQIVTEAGRLLALGADILDVGGESTRPGAKAVSAEEETNRVLPVVQAIHQAYPQALISVDTRKATVAETALQAGARMVNDVSGLQFDAEMAAVVARHQARLVIMHSQGTPETMQQNPSYPQGVVRAVVEFLQQQTAKAITAGVTPENIIWDPGFGFGKTEAHNLELLRELALLCQLGYPVLVGTSRKSFLTLDQQKAIGPEQREPLTAASLAIALANGATLVRLHDLDTQIPVVRLIEKVCF